MDSYILSIGYPIGANERNQTYEIEVEDKIIELTIEEMKMWVTMQSFQKKSFNSQEEIIVGSLRQKEAVICAENIDELYEKIKNCIVYRQGFFCVDGKKISLLLGKEIFYPTMTQYLIWKYGDGHYTIEDIKNFLVPELNVIDFGIQFQSLYENGIVLIK